MGKEKVRIDAVGHVLNVHTEDGSEIPDPVPMAPPVGFVRQPPLHDRIRAMVQHEYRRARELNEVETPEEADDFLIEGADDSDDPREARFALMPGHEWEDNYEPPNTFKEMHDRLVAAGWSPPLRQEAAEQGTRKSDENKPPLDAAEVKDNNREPPRGSAKPR